MEKRNLESEGQCAKEEKHIAANVAMKGLSRAIDALEAFVANLDGSPAITDEKVKETGPPSLVLFLDELTETIKNYSDRIQSAIQIATQKLY